MDHHHPCFIWRFGGTKEDVHAPDGKITTPTRFPTTETPGSTIFTVSITGITSKLRQYIYILLTFHMHSDSVTTKRTPFNDILPSSQHTKRSLLPFLADTFSWLTGTATTKDVQNIKQRVNQLIKSQTQQQETLVHVISILNVTRYAMQVNRQHINTVMEAIERTYNDVTTLFNISSSIHSHINYQQILLLIHSILANFRDSLYYMRQIAMHAMDYIDAVTTGILSPYVLPAEDLQEMLIHIEVELPSTMHLPVSSDDTLHLYRYLHTHVLVAEEQFLLIIDVPIQDCTQQLEINHVFNLFILKGNISA